MDKGKSMNTNIVSGLKKTAICGRKGFCPNSKKMDIQAGKTMQKQQIGTIFKSRNIKIEKHTHYLSFFITETRGKNPNPNLFF